MKCPEEEDVEDEGKRVWEGMGFHNVLECDVVTCCC